MNAPKEQIRIDFSKKHKEGKATLRVVTFKDGDYQIAYIPSLNLSGYGNTDSEATNMLLNIVLKDYLVSLLKLESQKILAELRACGWERRPYLSKQLTNTQFLSIDKIKESFDLPAETQIDEQFVTA